MPTPSKFNEETRERILQALRIGASRRTASAAAGVNESTLRRWVERGEKSSSSSRWGEFVRQIEEAEAAPKLRALGIVYKELPDKPDLAWKFLERREAGFAPPAATGPAGGPQGPVVIELQFADGSPVELPHRPLVIEGEVVEDEPQEATVRALGAGETA